MLSDQNNCCAICGTTEPSKTRGRHKRFHVDNDPSGKVRGLLCKSCHIALGEVDGNIDTLKSMIDYLKNHED